MHCTHFYSSYGNHFDQADVMEGIELKIMKEIHKIESTNRYANADEIASAVGLSNQDTLDFLEMLKNQGYVRLKAYLNNVTIIFLTPQGRLLLTHPDYMFNKGYGDARDVLKAIENAVTDSEDIPPEEKASLTGKIKDLYHDPYMQSISSGLIVEGLKKIFSF